MNNKLVEYKWGEETLKRIQKVSKGAELKNRVLAMSCWLARLCRFQPMEEEMNFSILPLTLSVDQKSPIHLSINPKEPGSYLDIVQQLLNGINNNGAKDFKEVIHLEIGEFTIQPNRKIQLLFDWENDQVKLSWNPNKLSWEEGSITKDADLFFEELLKEPKSSIYEAQLLSADSENELISRSANWEYNLPDTTLLDQFKNIVKQNESKVALTMEDKALTYGELDALSTQLAIKIKDEIPTEEQRIPLYMKKSTSFVVAILAIVKLGKSYVPLDPETVQNRFETWKKRYPNQYFIDADKLKQLMSQNNGELSMKPVARKADSALYTMFTSGTTGEPKEVTIPDRAVLSLCVNNEAIHFNHSTNCLSAADSSFDAFTLELWATLLNGGKLTLHPNPLDFELFYEIVNKENIDTMWLTSSLFNRIIDVKPDLILPLKYLYVGGEKLSSIHVKKFLEMNNHVRLFNGYGPTECTTFTHVYEVSRTKNYPEIPLGKTISGRHALVTDSYGGVVPTGVVGELRLGGSGLATKIGEKADYDQRVKPFVLPNNTEVKLYKSGDYGFLDKDGLFHYKGRKDGQLKINGYRIEAGEIQKLFMKQTNALKAVLVQDKSEGIKKHFMFYTAIKSAELEESVAEFKKNQPAFMSGVIYQHVEEFRLNKNGKMDIPFMVQNSLDQRKMESPHTEKEVLIRSSFAKILGKKGANISITDDFFDLGGDSLNSVALCADLAKVLDITITDVHRYRTIKELALNINYRKEGLASSVFSEFNSMSKELDIPNDELKKRDDLYHKKLSRIQSKLSKKPYNHALVIGANGFLGVHVLHELMKIPELKITCLLRNDDKTCAKEKLINSYNRFFGELNIQLINIQEGEASEAQFGLSNQEFSLLGAEIDVVYNCSGKVAIFGEEEEFMKNNLKVVEQLVHFCQEFKAELHHTSSTMVADGEDKDWIYFTEFDQCSANISDRPYAKSKMLAEKVIEEAKTNGVVATIYRIGNLSCSFQTGKYSDEPERNIVFRHIKSHFELGFFPNVEISYEMLAVDEVAKAMVLLSQNNSDVKRFHLLRYTENNFPRLIFEALQEKNNQLEWLEASEYQDAMLNLLNDSNNSKYAEEWIVRSGMLADKKEVVIKSELTDHTLQELGFKWSANNLSSVSKMIEMLINSGMIKLESLTH